MALVFFTRVAIHGIHISSSVFGGDLVVSAMEVVWLDCVGVGYLQHFGSQRVQVYHLRDLFLNSVLEEPSDVSLKSSSQL